MIWLRFGIPALQNIDVRNGFTRFRQERLQFPWRAAERF